VRGSVWPGKASPGCGSQGDGGHVGGAAAARLPHLLECGAALDGVAVPLQGFCARRTPGVPETVCDAFTLRVSRSVAKPLTAPRCAQVGGEQPGAVGAKVVAEVSHLQGGLHDGRVARTRAGACTPAKSFPCSSSGGLSLRMHAGGRLLTECLRGRPLHPPSATKAEVAEGRVQLSGAATGRVGGGAWSAARGDALYPVGAHRTGGGPAEVHPQPATARLRRPPPAHAHRAAQAHAAAAATRCESGATVSQDSVYCIEWGLPRGS